MIQKIIEWSIKNKFMVILTTAVIIMAASSILAITIIPVLMAFFVKEEVINANTSKKQKSLQVIGN